MFFLESLIYTVMNQWLLADLNGLMLQFNIHVSINNCMTPPKKKNQFLKKSMLIVKNKHNEKFLNYYKPLNINRIFSSENRSNSDSLLQIFTHLFMLVRQFEKINIDNFITK